MRPAALVAVLGVVVGPAEAADIKVDPEGSTVLGIVWSRPTPREMVATLTLCVATNKDARVTVAAEGDGAGGQFAAVGGGAALPFTLEVDERSLSRGEALDGLPSGGDTCAAKTTTGVRKTVTVRFPAEAFQAALAGTYRSQIRLTFRAD